MGTIFVNQQSMEAITCGACGTLFALPTQMLDARRADGKNFYCPNGHPRVFRETTADRLRIELQRKEEMLVAANARAASGERRASSITKAHRKMRARVFNGVCPCCQRSFGNLRAHMQHMHPDFGREKTLRAMREAFGMSQANVASEAGVSAPHVSLYETGKSVAPYVKEQLERWVDNHAGDEIAEQNND